MKLIREQCEDVKQLITEEAGGKQYYIEGLFLQAEIKNRNGRVYPLATLEREVARYNSEFVATKRALGELGHPDSPQINLDRASHLITELRGEGRNFHGRAKILDTPNGMIVKALINEGVQLGVSSRGVGSLQNSSEGSIVGEDFYLATAADIVADPSAPAAFVRGIMESKEWIWQNGILTEGQIATYQKELKAAPKKKVAARKLNEAKVWEHFMKSIRVISEREYPNHDAIGNVIVLPAGNGFYETDNYPIGGSFHRSKVDLEIKVERVFDSFKGVDAEGICVTTGKKIAFKLESTYKSPFNNY